LHPIHCPPNQENVPSTRARCARGPCSDPDRHGAKYNRSHYTRHNNACYWSINHTIWFRNPDGVATPVLAERNSLQDLGLNSKPDAYVSTSMKLLKKNFLA